MTPVRIAMLLHKSVEHDSRVRREAKALAETGHEVTVLHLPRVHGELDGTLDGFEVVSVTPPQWVRRHIPFALYRIVFLASFVRAIRRLGPDVVHAHDAAMLAPGYLGARLVRARLVYDSHEYAAGVPYRERAWALFVTSLERALIRKCAAVITVSDGIADRLAERYGLSHRPTVVRNVPDPSAYDRAFRAPDLRAALGIDSQTPLVLHLGAAATDRGCEALVRAMADLPEAHLLFLGADDGAYVDGLLALAAQSGVSERVHFRPSVPIAHVLSYVEQASVGVSLLEDTCENHRLALPNKVFEYLAAGVPVVVSDLPEMRRALATVPGSAFVTATDPQSLTHGIERAVAAAPRVGESGRLVAEFTWEDDAGRLADTYDGILPSLV